MTYKGILGHIKLFPGDITPNREHSPTLIPEPPSSPFFAKNNESCPLNKHTNISKKSSLSKFNKPNLKVKKLKKKKGVDCCSCSKTHCMRLNCSCFKMGRTCGIDCVCNNCFNQPSYSKLRSFVIEKTKHINSKAFNSVLAEINELSVKVNTQGCQCKKGCNNRYCYCSANGVGCSPICRCEGCLNKRIELTSEQVKKIIKKERRKKERIKFQSECSETISLQSWISLEKTSTVDSGREKNKKFNFKLNKVKKEV